MILWAYQVVRHMQKMGIKKVNTKLSGSKSQQRLSARAIKEPCNSFRRLDEHSGTDDYYLNILFTIDMSDGYAIVWENIDISLDKATYVFRAIDTDYEPKIKISLRGYPPLPNSSQPCQTNVTIRRNY